MGIVLLPLLLCSCESVTFDARQLPQPMVLNDNPFLGPTNSFSLVLTKVDQYAATTEYEEYNLYTTKEEEQQTHHVSVNEAQVKAFEKIGGQTNRFIRNVALNASAVSACWLFYAGSDITVEAQGNVTEFHSVADTNVPVAVGGANP